MAMNAEFVPPAKTKQDLEQAANMILQRLPASSPPQFRQLVQQLTGATNLSDTAIARLATESEARYSAIAQNPPAGAGSPSERIALRDCLRDCQTEHSRCINTTRTGDILGRFICNLQGEACVVGCGVDSFAAPGMGGILNQ